MANFFKKVLVGLQVLILSLPLSATAQSSTTTQNWIKKGVKLNAISSTVTQICNKTGVDCLSFAGGSIGDMLKSVYDPTNQNKDAFSLANILGVFNPQAFTGATADATPTDDDIIGTINDPLGTPASRKVTLANLYLYIKNQINTGGALDNVAYLDQANTFTSTGNTSFAGKVGIGTTTPDEKLEIAGRLHLGQTTAPTTTTDKLYNVGGTAYFNGHKIENTGITQTETGVTSFDITIVDGLITSFTKN